MSNFDKLSIIKKENKKKKAQVKPKIDLDFSEEYPHLPNCSCCVKINMFKEGWEEELKNLINPSSLRKISSDDEIVK